MFLFSFLQFSALTEDQSPQENNGDNIPIDFQKSIYIQVVFIVCVIGLTILGKISRIISNICFSIVFVLFVLCFLGVIIFTFTNMTINVSQWFSEVCSQKN